MKQKLILTLSIILTLSGCNQKKEATYVKEIKEDPRAFNMIYVEGGEFTMGSSEVKDNPPHQVILSDFYMSDIEVTQSLYEEIMGVNPVEFKDIGINKPVYYVSWYSAVEFCNKLSIRDNYTPCYEINGEEVICDFTKNGYRLPTEAEWEYTARGGKLSQGYKYSGSDNLDEVAFYVGNHEGSIFPEVALKKSNELGIFDMVGSVEEWCWNSYSYIYMKDSNSNSQFSNEDNKKIVRGESYASIRISDKVLTKRIKYFPKDEMNPVGFRICRSKVDK